VPDFTIPPVFEYNGFRRRIMHNSRWTPLRINNDFINGKTVYYTYVADTEYNAVMLVEDLLEAGIAVKSISCEKATGAVNCAPETFLKNYEQIRSDDTEYIISCMWNDIPFQACTGDDISGRSYSRIIISSESLCFDVNHLVSRLCK
jgi:hypothetical protein